MLITNHISDRFDWSEYPKKIAPPIPKKLRNYQEYALNDVLDGFNTSDRGKLIMACGTGKTLVSLHVAEKIAGKGSFILYLVPSISLILQSMREWSENANIPHYYMAVCSDKSVRNTEQGTLTELEAPASTDLNTLNERIKQRKDNTMNVIFSTHHSIEIVCDAMKGKKFDMIFCDEAHRTTGIEEKDSESFYTMVHHNKNVNGLKRLYMTATPKIYTPNIKGKAMQLQKTVISMDDKIYGPEFHNLSFYDAVHKYHALCDFKVRVAVMDGDTMDGLIQRAQKGDDNQIPLDEKSLMASVWHALQYPGVGEEKDLLQRVIMFCDMINSSKILAGEEIKYKADIRENPELLEKNREIDKHRSFGELVGHIKTVVKDTDSHNVEVEHVDGGDNAQYRRSRLDWLKNSQVNPHKCRILSNARCLSEGVDVPALDGVVFMNPRRSVVDVVQAVGRVMRKSPGKEYGYVILPVAIPAGISVDEAFKDSKYFKVVWQVLNALRSHDPKLDSEINTLAIDSHGPDNAITNRIIIRHAYGHDLISYKELEKKIIQGVTTELVRKVGDINYYDKYGEKLGERANTIEARLRIKIKSNDTIKKEMDTFHEGLKQIINESVTFEDTIKALSQHVVLSFVFDELFSKEFSSQNPISVAFNKMIQKIGFKEELDILDEFYNDVKKEISLIESDVAKQNFIKKLYGNFFESADKKGAEQHGIVYTPVEIIDFIINSVQHVLKTEFGKEFNDRDVKVLDPFTGTGTFLVRLLQSGFITTNLYEKYKHDLYANEMILLAYYTATINIETAYSSMRQGNKHVPFDGINYTDTLEMNPLYRQGRQHRQTDTKLDEIFKEAHSRVRHQRGSHLHVIMGNPPYSVGQSNFNDQNQNASYPEIDKRIEQTYRKKTKELNPKIGHVGSLYDSYIRSLRWASDRIGNSGAIGFVTNASFIKSDAAAGLRACLQEEFTDVWVFDLRGNAMTQGEIRKKEAGNIFGSGSKTPVAITILVKNPNKKSHTIRYCDIGDYHSREKKLEIIKTVSSIKGIKDWQEIKPDRHHDWIDHRHDKFTDYFPMGSKDAKAGKGNAIFGIYSSGIKTNRDVWAYNSSRKELSKNMQRCIIYANSQDFNNLKIEPKKGKLDRESLKRLKSKKHNSKFNNNKIRRSLYRPFFKQWLYFDYIFNNMQGLLSKTFPKNDSENLVIVVPDKGIGERFSVLMSDITPDLHLIAQSQCFPLYIYENGKKQENITNITLNEYQEYYKDKKITKEDIFYYVYGLLHHLEYRKKYANNLSHELPHIPMAPDFHTLSKIGKQLADLHLSWETCKRYNLGKPKAKFEKYTKMVFVKKEVDDKQVIDHTKLKINGIEVFDNIPETNYKVNGRTPLE